MRRFALFFIMLLAVQPAQAEVKVVASVAPVAGLAAAVMAGVGQPQLLITNNASPHTYQLRPSDAAALAQADVIFWVGEGLETALGNVLEDNPKAVELLGLPGLRLHPVRAGGVWEEEADEDDAHEEHHGHDHGSDDPHFWLDPLNAVAVTLAMAEKLATLDPAHAEAYRHNAHAFNESLMELDQQIAQRLKPYQDRGFVVFHDAYQYFEQRYNLRGAGSITLSPEVPPSAARLQELQQRLGRHQVVCVFAEPQFKDSLVKTLVRGTTARTGLLNVDASEFAVSAGLYPAYLQQLAQRFEDCLKP